MLFVIGTGLRTQRWELSWGPWVAQVVTWTLLREAEDLDPRKPTKRSRGRVETQAWKTTVMQPPAKDCGHHQELEGQGGPP